GWNPDLKAHIERRRLAEPFLQFVRSEVSGGMAQTNYFESATASAARSAHSAPETARLGSATPLVAPYTASSYTMIVSGSMGSRWTVFPAGLNWYASSSGEPGAPGNGVTAVQTGIAS